MKTNIEPKLFNTLPQREKVKRHEIYAEGYNGTMKLLDVKKEVVLVRLPTRGKL